MASGVLRGTRIETLERKMVSAFREDSKVGTLKRGVAEMKPCVFVSLD